MGTRGPKPGFKKARAALAAAPSLTSEQPKPEQADKPAVVDVAVLAAPAAPAAPAEAKAAKTKAVEPVPPVAQKPKADPAPVDIPTISAADRENPQKLSGAALRELGHRRGLARSTMATMTDEKIRMELRYIVNRQYTEDAVA